jgi:hypothetical protein
MSSLYEKKKSINKRISRSNRIVKDLDSASENYTQGRYTSLAEDIFKVKKLDPDNPRAAALQKHAERREKQQESPKDNQESCCGRDEDPFNQKKPEPGLIHVISLEQVEQERKERQDRQARSEVNVKAGSSSEDIDQQQNSKKEDDVHNCKIENERMPRRAARYPREVSLTAGNFFLDAGISYRRSRDRKKRMLAGIVILMIAVILGSYLITGKLMGDLIWVGDTIMDIANILWSVVKLTYLLVAAVVKFVIEFLILIFELVIKVVEFVINMIDRLREVIEVLIK